MRRFALILLAVGLLALAIFTAVEGYRNYRLFVRSLGTVETNIRLDVPGTFAVTLDPPGRSVYFGRGAFWSYGCHGKELPFQ